MVTSRGDVHYIATEYGIVDLHGRNLRERALALIDIAHPDFRNELIDYARKRNLVHMDQMPMTSGKYYPEEFEETAVLGDIDVFFRPIKPSDEDLGREFFYSLSDETIYYRFFNIVKAMPHEKMQPLVNIDYRDEMAIAGFVGEPGEEEMVAVGRYKIDPADNLAEIAFLVGDNWQKRGIGTYLFNKMTDIAIKRGISGFKAEVLAQNRKMMYVFHKSRFPVKTKLEDGAYYLEIWFTGEEQG